jgi:glucokinase
MGDIEFLSDRPASIAGINIGGTNTTVVGGCEDGTIVSRWRGSTIVDDGNLLIEQVVAAVRQVAPTAHKIGIAVGGPLNVKRGQITDAVHLPGLHGVNLRDRIADATGRATALHHDAAACALAEWRWGLNAGVDGLAYLTCGTGFGCGLVLGGKVRYGADGRSPEIGHVRYREEGPAIFGKPGCYEGYASANALGLMLSWRKPKDFPIATPLQVIDEVRKNNPDAKWALRENERAVATACAMLVDLLALDCIVLGALATYLGDPWVARVREFFRDEALTVNADVCVVRGAMDDVQDKSALAAALDADEQKLWRKR